MQEVSPHIHKRVSTKIIMWIVVVALLPATLFGVYSFGFHSARIILISIFAALITELVINMVKRKKPSIGDGSALLTGLLLALTLSPKVPLWMPVIGSVVAIAIAKHMFGGLGHNIFNPALVGRAFLVAAWPMLMGGWLLPLEFGTDAWLNSYDGVTGATPLGKLGTNDFSYMEMFIGRTGGTIGETSALFLLIGGLLLILTRIIDWRIPLGYIGTVALGAFVFGNNALLHILGGGLFIGAFFMATDYVTSPLTRKGRFVFAIGCGILTIVMRLFSGMAEGVMFSILIMNAFVPLIDRFIKPRRFGT